MDNRSHFKSTNNLIGVVLCDILDELKKLNGSTEEEHDEPKHKRQFLLKEIKLFKDLPENWHRLSTDELNSLYNERTGK